MQFQLSKAVRVNHDSYGTTTKDEVKCARSSLSKKGRPIKPESEVFSIEAGYDLEVSPREYPAFVVRGDST